MDFSITSLDHFWAPCSAPDVLDILAFLKKDFMKTILSYVHVFNLCK